MATITAWGAHEVARTWADRVTMNSGKVLTVNREFIMTSDGRVLTRDRDWGRSYTIVTRYVPDSMRNLDGLLEIVRANRYHQALADSTAVIPKRKD